MRASHGTHRAQRARGPRAPSVPCAPETRRPRRSRRAPIIRSRALYVRSLSAGARLPPPILARKVPREAARDPELLRPGPRGRRGRTPRGGQSSLPLGNSPQRETPAEPAWGRGPVSPTTGAAGHLSRGSAAALRAVLHGVGPSEPTPDSRDARAALEFPLRGSRETNT